MRDLTGTGLPKEPVGGGPTTHPGKTTCYRNANEDIKLFLYLGR